MFKALANYPREVMVGFRDTLLWIVALMGVSVLLSGYFFVASVSNGGSLAWAAVFCALAFFLSFVLFSSVSSRKSSYKDLVVAPYFDVPVPGMVAGETGKILTRNMRRLDEIAPTLGVKALSDFGYEDDLYYKVVIWHDPREGVRTIDELLTFLGTREENEILGMDSIADVKKALIRLRARLDSARHVKAKFSLLLRSFVAGAEVVRNRRKGHL